MNSTVDENLWRTSAFRSNVVQKIEEAIQKSSMPTSKTSVEMESHVYQKAETKDEYLSFVARLILHVKEMNSNNRGQMGGQQPQPVGPPTRDPVNALRAMAHQGGNNQMINLMPQQGNQQMHATSCEMELPVIVVPENERRAVEKFRYTKSAKEFILHYSEIIHNYPTADPPVPLPTESAKLDAAIEFLLVKKGVRPAVLYNDAGWPSPRIYSPTRRCFIFKKLRFDVTILNDPERLYVLFDFDPDVYFVFGCNGNSIPLIDDVLHYNETRFQVLSDHLYSHFIDKIKTGDLNALRIPKFVKDLHNNIEIKVRESDCDRVDKIKCDLYDRLGNVDPNWNPLKRLFVSLMFLFSENQCTYETSPQQPHNYMVQPYHGQVVEMRRVHRKFFVSLVDAPVSVFVMFANSERNFVHGYRILQNWVPEFIDNGLCISNDNGRLTNLNFFIAAALIAFFKVENSAVHSRRSSFSEDSFNNYVCRNIGLGMGKDINIEDEESE